jgi:N-formylglutamate amidohydrolase
LNTIVDPFILHAPALQMAPVVFASAHSGRDYPAEFVASARLDTLTLRRSEDSFVDELFDAAPAAGAPLLTATFPRAFCDLNREAWELDPAMFDDALPDWVNTGSERVAAGLGTIARVVGSGEAIYRDKLRFSEAQRRVRDYWQPWHTALDQLVARTRTTFGVCVLIDCHSMPTRPEHRLGAGADFVLGDVHGASCAPGVIGAVQMALRGQGYRVARNDPYAGGYITRHHGRPRQGTHALQIEVARDLYMDEQLIEKTAGFEALRLNLGALIVAIVRHATELLPAR